MLFAEHSPRHKTYILANQYVDLYQRDDSSWSATQVCADGLCGHPLGEAATEAEAVALSTRELLAS